LANWYEGTAWSGLRQACGTENRTRQLAVTQKLDIEGCDPLTLPLAALMCQQANNFWVRKLAHGREVYLIPAGKSRLLSSELLKQLRTRGVDLDKVSQCRARQDGKLLDKTNNTKYAAQQIADIIHSWVPPEQPIQTPNINSPSSGIKWHNYAKRVGDDAGDSSTPTPNGPIGIQSCDHTHPKGPHEQLNQSITSTNTSIRSKAATTWRRLVLALLIMLRLSALM